MMMMMMMLVIPVEDLLAVNGVQELHGGCRESVWGSSDDLSASHCRNCGNVFCASCCDQKIPVPSQQLFEPSRVCKTCYSSLQLGPAPLDLELDNPITASSNWAAEVSRCWRRAQELHRMSPWTPRVYLLQVFVYRWRLTWSWSWTACWHDPLTNVCVTGNGHVGNLWGGGGAALPGLSRENGHPGGLIQAGRQAEKVAEGLWGCLVC